MRRQVAVELARFRGRRPVQLAWAAGLLVTGTLAARAGLDVLTLGGGAARVAATGQARGVTLVVLLAAVALAAGAATAGGDWATGSLRGQLLVDARRSRLWLAKSLAVTAGALLVAALLIAGFCAGLLATASVRGTAPSAGALAYLAGLAGRGLVLVTLASLGGWALALAVRSTTTAVVLVLSVVLADGALLGLLPVAGAGEWGLHASVLAWLRGGTRVVARSACTTGHRCDPGPLVSLSHGAAVLGALLAVTLLVSWLTFRRRDVP